MLRYAGLGAQILVAIGIAVFVGLKVDQWLKLAYPFLVWFLPLATVGSLIFKIIKDTSKDKKHDVKK